MAKLFQNFKAAKLSVKDPNKTIKIRLSFINDQSGGWVGFGPNCSQNDFATLTTKDYEAASEIINSHLNSNLCLLLHSSVMGKH